MLILSAELDSEGEHFVYSITRVGLPELNEAGLTDPSERLRELVVPDIEMCIQVAREDAFAPILEQSDFAAEKPMSASEVTRKLDALHGWLQPTEMQALVEDLSRAAGRRDFRSNPFKPVREAWVISRFASHTNADDARHLRQTTAAPDGEVRYGDRVVAVEVTEAFESWRKPHGEKPGLEHDPLEKWEERFREIQPQLVARIEEKARKPYAASTALLVYLNINEYGVRQAFAVATIERLLTRYRSRFGGLHVLWKDQWY